MAIFSMYSASHILRHRTLIGASRRIINTTSLKHLLFTLWIIFSARQTLVNLPLSFPLTSVQHLITSSVLVSSFLTPLSSVYSSALPIVLPPFALDVTGTMVLLCYMYYVYHWYSARFNPGTTTFHSLLILLQT